MTDETSPIFGAMARFGGPGELLAAAQHMRQRGYRRLDAYSPFPVHGMDEALGLSRSKVPLIVLIGGLAGAALGYLLQWYTSSVDYRVMIGGKPYNSREAWVPITFETMVLLASFAAVFGMLALNGLPRLYHPVFRSESFRRASNDGFFLTVEASDPLFHPDRTLAELASLGGNDLEVLEA